VSPEQAGSALGRGWTRPGDRPPRLLLLGSPAEVEVLRSELTDALPGTVVLCSRGVDEATETLRGELDAVLVDLQHLGSGPAGAGDGLQVVAHVRATRADLAIVVLVGAGAREVAFEALELGADDQVEVRGTSSRDLATVVHFAIRRRRMQREGGELGRLAVDLLDSIESPTCAVDSHADIFAVNRAWQEFSLAGGGSPQRTGVGVNYLEACRASPRGELPTDVDSVCEGLMAVLSGALDRFEHTYSCHSPQEHRWFSLRINPLPSHGGAVVTHLDVTAARELTDALAHQGLHDPLTDLPNRVLLADRLDQALAVAAREGRRVALAFLDVDNFKRINDSLGHDAGDELLRAVASRLNGQVRGGDTVSRFAGDEFVAVWPSVATMQEAQELAKRLTEAFEAPFLLSAATVTVSASVGLAVSVEGHSADELLLAADAAMYDAKSHDRGRMRTYNEELRADAAARLGTELELREGLTRGEFVLHYQPVVDLRRNVVSGVEALLRWQHPDGLRMPDTFIPVAESSGLIVTLGTWVLQEACRQAATWAAVGLELDMAVNLSTRQISHPDIVATIQSALRLAALEPARLMLEVTESTVMEDAEVARVALSNIRGLGVSVAIDDFGTGYSSLLYLKRYPVQSLKIDRVFVAGMGIHDDDDAIVASVVGLARAVGASCIAEGVETQEQHAALRALGCGYAQGYLFSHPVPAEQFPDSLAQVRRALLASPSSADAPRQQALPPVASAIVERIASLQQAGFSFRSIAAALNSAGAPHPRGVRWHSSSVAVVCSDIEKDAATGASESAELAEPSGPFEVGLRAVP
jgi:diguanylate cyclase (GGDEF)-like protein